MAIVSEIAAKSILVPQRFGSLSSSYDYTINPYAGCAFACSYCYVPKFPNDAHHFSEWGSWVHVKTNAPELIRKERSRIFGSKIFFCSATDPYQYLELKYRITRRCLEELQRYKPSKLTVHTRSHLMLQDLELIKSFGKAVSVGVSFTTDDEAVRREFEPSAPSLSRRLELIRKLHEAGVSVYVSMAPLLPCNPARLHEMLSPYIQKAWVGAINYPEINNRPELLKTYADFFEEKSYLKTIHTLASAFKVYRIEEPQAVASMSARQKTSNSEVYPAPPTRAVARVAERGQLKLFGAAI